MNFWLFHVSIGTSTRNSLYSCCLSASMSVWAGRRAANIWVNHWGESGQIGARPVRVLTLTGGGGELVTLLAHRLPTVPGLELDGRCNGQESRQVAGALPFMIVNKLRAAGPIAVVSPTDHEGLQPVLHFTAGVEESRPLRRTEPLVTGTGVEIRANGRQMQRDMAWGVGAVNDAQQPGGTRAAADRFHRKREGRGAGNVTEKNDLRLLGNPVPEGLHPGVGVSNWERDGLPHVACTGLVTDEAPGAIHGPILVIGGEDLVMRTQSQAAGQHIDGGRRIGEIDDFVGRRSEVGCQLRTGVRHQCGGLSPKKGHRLPLQLTLPGLVGLEDRQRASAERAVVEEHDVRVEQEECFESRHGYVLR